MTNLIHQKIKLAGGRLTKIRKTILDILVRNQCLISKDEIVKKLAQKQITPDRSTIYRELQYLSAQHLSIGVSIGVRS